jgi:protein tyrosine phosphatase (PTP) superfamily phosphohydrolase (DUF442 family)
VRDLLAFFTVRFFLVVSIIGIFFWTCGCSRIVYNEKIVSMDPLLARSARPTLYQLEQLHDAWRNSGGIKTIINLECKIQDAEATFMFRHQGVNIYSFCWSARKEPSVHDIENIIKLFKNKNNYPMLIHCRAGADRTGLAIALWQIEIGKMSPERAISEMKWFKNIYPWFPEMQDTVIQRYEVDEEELWVLTVYYFLRDTLFLPVSFIEILIQEVLLF